MKLLKTASIKQATKKLLEFLGQIRDYDLKLSLCTDAISTQLFITTTAFKGFKET